MYVGNGLQSERWNDWCYTTSSEKTQVTRTQPETGGWKNSLWSVSYCSIFASDLLDCGIILHRFYFGFVFLLCHSLASTRIFSSPVEFIPITLMYVFTLDFRQVGVYPCAQVNDFIIRLGMIETVSSYNIELYKYINYNICFLRHAFLFMN